jgi:hypothetical protein
MANESHGTTSVLAPFPFCQIFITRWKKPLVWVTHPNTIPIKVDLTSNFLRNFFFNSSFIIILFIYLFIKVKNHFKFNNFCSIWFENCEMINMHIALSKTFKQYQKWSKKALSYGGSQLHGHMQTNKQTNTNLS